MEREFVPYELAVKLKELGFDEPCLFAFDNCSTPMRCTDLRTSEQKFNGVNYNSSTYTSQPTFSQAFRWFREKYNLLNEIAFYRDDKRTKKAHWYFIHEWNKDFTKRKTIKYSIYFKTYEEAELACLDKLIEIVETK